MSVDSIRSRHRIGPAFFLFALLSQSALAGPPMVTNDPGVMDPGKWQFILYAAGAENDLERGWDLPGLDVSIGLFKNVQASFLVSRAVLDPANAPSNTGWGVGQLGLTWQFLTTENFQLAFSPLYEFNITNSSIRRGLVSEENNLLLPAVGQYDFGSLYVIGEFGYSINTRGDNEWVYGSYVGVPVGERVELMAELYGGADAALTQNILNYNFGIIVSLSEKWDLLSSVGSGIHDNASPANEEINWTAYLGLQWSP